ncbi:hypothetical protein [Dongia sp.]|uniref:hypothetical protein n=1 Tax=Dongia sp. TaxID=1977262 RepID=UPI0037536886
MHTDNVIQLAPALERQRRVMGGISLLAWNNNFPDGIEDLWTGPFKAAGSSTVVRLFVH